MAKLDLRARDLGYIASAVEKLTAAAKVLNEVEDRTIVVKDVEVELSWSEMPNMRMNGGYRIRSITPIQKEA